MQLTYIHLLAAGWCLSSLGHSPTDKSELIFPKEEQNFLVLLQAKATEYNL